MRIWDKLAFSQDLKKYRALFLPPHRTDVSDDGEVFARGEGYCKVSLVEMRLAKGIEYFTRRYPIVHTTISFVHGNEETVIPYLAGPGFLKELSRDNLDRIINRNHPLTPLFPFNRGEVKLQAGLQHEGQRSD